MKPSIYNFVIYRNGLSYWYNALNHTFFTLGEPLGMKVEKALSIPGLIGQLPTTLREKLQTGGFIVEENVDELRRVFDNNETASNSNDFLITILPTLDCNFHCWYCIQKHIKDSQMSPEVVERVKKYISNVATNKKPGKINIEWFGGEPFMCTDIIKDISEHAAKVCDENGCSFVNSATTNGYYLTEDTVPWLKKYNFARFQITLDGVKESHDKVKFQQGCESAFGHVLGNIDTLLKEMPELRIVLRINYTHENINANIVGQVCKFIRPENRHRISIMPKKVWQVESDEKFPESTNHIWEEFKKEGFHVHNTNIVHDFMPCYTCRKNYIAINHDGNVLKCTATDDLYTEESKGHIDANGEIIWDDEYDNIYRTKSFDNEQCTSCKYLPLCMGVCPRNYAPNQIRCKKDTFELTFEDSIINEIESAISDDKTTISPINTQTP